MNPPVSVIITNYNLEAYIADAIRSVRDQEYAGDVEILVVDDASSDGGPGIISGFPDVRLIRNEENQGVLLSTLIGLEAASHDIVFFLDGDDVWNGDKLARTAPLFSLAGVALVTHDIEYMNGAGRTMPRRSLIEEEMSKVPSEGRGARVIEGILALGTYVWLGSAFAIHRRRARIVEFIRWARELPDPRRTYQDWPLAYWIASLPGIRAAYDHSKLMRYRVHAANYSGDASTPDRMRRNLIKARNTNAAMLDLADARQLDNGYRHRADQRCRFNQFHLDLLDGRRARAAGSLWQLRSELRHRRILLKEIVRFLGFVLLGPERFLGLANRQTLLPVLRPS
jgi:glycosyltransferase involved in cell wall biosynthesis